MIQGRFLLPVVLQVVLLFGVGLWRSPGRKCLIASVSNGRFIDHQRMTEQGPFLTADIGLPVCGTRMRRDSQGLHGGQHHARPDAMVAQIDRHGDRQRNGDCFYGFGKVFHNCTVLGSTATGMPRAFSAQCSVNPRQTSAPVSAWVMM